MEIIAAAWQKGWSRRLLMLCVEFPIATLIVSVAETVLAAIVAGVWSWLVLKQGSVWPNANFYSATFPVIAGINALALYFVYLPCSLHFTKHANSR